MSERKDTIDKIHIALEEIRPYLKSDGGDISFVELTDDKIVRIQLHGACTDCTVNQMTLKSGVEMTIRKHVPDILRVEQAVNS